MIELKSENNRNSLPTLSWSQVSAFRVHRHHLDRRAPLKSLETVVGDVCGVQAQLMSAAEIALWARVQHLRREDVERALLEGAHARQDMVHAGGSPPFALKGPSRLRGCPQAKGSRGTTLDGSVWSWPERG